MATRGIVKAIATCPISKEAMSLAGIPYPGQTEALADLTETREFAMLQYSTSLSVAFATTHLSYAEVPRALTTERIVTVGRLAARLPGHRTRT